MDASALLHKLVETPGQTQELPITREAFERWTRVVVEDIFASDDDDDLVLRRPWRDSISNLGVRSEAVVRCILSSLTCVAGAAVHV